MVHTYIYQYGREVEGRGRKRRKKNKRKKRNRKERRHEVPGTIRRYFMKAWVGSCKLNF